MPRLPRKAVYTLVGTAVIAGFVKLNPSSEVVKRAIELVGGMFMVLITAHAATDIIGGCKPPCDEDK